MLHQLRGHIQATFDLMLAYVEDRAGVVCVFRVVHIASVRSSPRLHCRDGSHSSKSEWEDKSWRVADHRGVTETRQATRICAPRCRQCQNTFGDELSCQAFPRWGRVFPTTCWRWMRSRCLAAALPQYDGRQADRCSGMWSYFVPAHNFFEKANIHSGHSRPAQPCPP